MFADSLTLWWLHTLTLWAYHKYLSHFNKHLVRAYCVQGRQFVARDTELKKSPFSLNKFITSWSQHIKTKVETLQYVNTPEYPRSSLWEMGVFFLPHLFVYCSLWHPSNTPLGFPNSIGEMTLGTRKQQCCERQHKERGNYELNKSHKESENLFWHSCKFWTMMNW